MVDPKLLAGDQTWHCDFRYNNGCVSVATVRQFQIKGLLLFFHLLPPWFWLVLCRNACFLAVSRGACFGRVPWRPFNVCNTGTVQCVRAWEGRGGRAGLGFTGLRTDSSHISILTQLACIPRCVQREHQGGCTHARNAAQFILPSTVQRVILVLLRRHVFFLLFFSLTCQRHSVPNPASRTRTVLGSGWLSS